MKRTLTCVCAAVVLSLGGLIFAADMGAMPMAATTQPTSQPSTQPAAVDLQNTKCPISGEDIGQSKLTLVYDGKIYHLCCAGCVKEFNKDPDSVAKKVAADPAKYGVKAAG